MGCRRNENGNGFLQRQFRVSPIGRQTDFCCSICRKMQIQIRRCIDYFVTPTNTFPHRNPSVQVNHSP